MKCPKCQGLTEPDDKSCSCGWRAEPTKAKPQPRLCAYNDHGYTCHQPGFLAQSTNGEGPWYCRAHFARIMKWPAWEAATEKPLSISVEEITKGLKEPYRTRTLKAQAIAAAGDDEPMSEVDKRVNKLVPRLPNESEHNWSMRCRDWTLAQLRQGRIGAQASREPGED